MKRLFLLLLSLVLSASLLACAADPAPTEETEPPLVGISLAGGGDELTNALADKLETEFPAYESGYRVAIQCAAKDPDTQIRQIEELVALGAKCLIIEAVDSLTLSATLSKIEIPIIACDAMLMDTDKVAACVTYDYEAIGKQMAEAVLAETDLKKPATVELFMGAPEHHGSILLHQGILSVLQPYFDEGKLLCKSGQLLYEDTYCVEDTDGARDTCLRRLRGTYTQRKPLNISLCATDTIAGGCRQALEKAGYTRKTWPLIASVGGSSENKQAVADGYQLLSVEKDPLTMARSLAEITHGVLSGGKLPKTTLHNHIKDVPTVFLLK